jgi:integrase/recombinase XerD
MTTEDVDWEERTILIPATAKGRRSRLLPLSDEVYHALWEWVRRFRRPADPGPLFLGRDGQPITAVAINRALWRLGERAGFPHRISPHDLRHTFCTQALSAGADVFAVKEIAGHEDIKTTLHYAKQRDMHTALRSHARWSPVSRALEADKNGSDRLS